MAMAPTGVAGQIVIYCCAAAIRRCGCFNVILLFFFEHYARKPIFRALRG